MDLLRISCPAPHIEVSPMERKHPKVGTKYCSYRPDLLVVPNCGLAVPSSASELTKSNKNTALIILTFCYGPTVYLIFLGQSKQVKGTWPPGEISGPDKRGEVRAHHPLDTRVLRCNDEVGWLNNIKARSVVYTGQ